MPLRENFIERVFAYYRWTEMLDQEPTPGGLVKFHTAHKLTLMAHSPRHYTEMGRLVADAGKRDWDELTTEYGAQLMEGLGMMGTRGKHVNVLQHLMGFLKNHLASEDKQELLGLIEDYRQGLLHLGVDSATHEIQAVVLTEASVDDAEVASDLLDQTSEPIEQFSADGAYDKRKVYSACEKRKIPKIAIPPRREARIWQHGHCAAAPLPRDENLRQIRKMGRRTWKQVSGYHQRSLAETAVFRLKTVFGDHLQSRALPQQVTEAAIKCAALNPMTQLGMPDSSRV